MRWSRFSKAAEFKDSLIYLAASIVGYGLVFIQSFYFAFIFDSRFYGEVILVLALFAMQSAFYVFGLNVVVQRFLNDTSHFQNAQDARSHTFVSWITISLVLSIILIVAGYFVVKQFHLLPIDFQTVFLPTLIAALLYSFTEIFPQEFIILKKPVRYAVCLIVSKLTPFIFLLLFVQLFGNNIQAICHGLVASSAVLLLTGSFAFRIFPLSSICTRKLRFILRFATPLAVNSLGGFGFSNGYRVIISTSLTFTQLGQFNIASQIANVFYLASSTFMTGFVPEAYKRLRESHGELSSINFYFNRLLLFSSVFAVTMIPATYLFLQYFKNGEFAVGFPVFLILLCGQFIFLIYNHSYIIVTYSGKTNLLSYSLFFGVLTSLILAYILVKRIGLEGAGIPLTLGYLVQVISIRWFIHHQLKHS